MPRKIGKVWRKKSLRLGGLTTFKQAIVRPSCHGVKCLQLRLVPTHAPLLALGDGPRHPVMCSQPWPPTPSTTTAAPELRTAKRSPARRQGGECGRFHTTKGRRHTERRRPQGRAGPNQASLPGPSLSSTCRAVSASRALWSMLRFWSHRWASASVMPSCSISNALARPTSPCSSGVRWTGA